MHGSIIEWKARRYRDPIQRLKYLRRATGARSRFTWSRIPISRPLQLVAIFLILFALRAQTVTETSADFPRAPAAPKHTVGPLPAGDVWLVETSGDHDVYSNGLRIENRFRTAGEPRSYVIFRQGADPENPAERRTEPAGIIFHTSESRQLPLIPEQNPALTRVGRNLLDYVSRNKSYNFVVDRFGRVFRIVPETDVANHAGYSVWADATGIYLNLNHSFLGVCFEAETGNMDTDRYLSGAQIDAGRLLLHMLMNKYKIAAADCVTHAQVSVDPETMVIGDHTDGAGNFPFDELGLPDNYLLPMPSLFEFGFAYDAHFMMAAGSRMLKGFILAAERFRRDAEEQSLPAAQYRELLRTRYRSNIATLKRLGIIKEKQNGIQ